MASYFYSTHRRALSLLFVLLISGFSAMAHQGIAKGNVSDSLSGESIEGVVIQILESNQLTSTDLLGNFSFADLHPGEYRFKLSMIGFETKTIPVIVNENQTSQLSVLLNPIAINIAEVQIHQNSQIGSPMLSLSKMDISLRPIRSSQDVLRMIPGLVTAQHGGGGKAEQIFLRGFDIDHGTDIRLSVDGMPVNMVSHAHGQGYSDLHFITPELIDYVDFNKGPYYAAMGDFCTAGYASFHTKKSLDNSMVKLEGGRFNSYRVLGVFDLLDKKAKAKNQNAYLASEYMFTNGYFESPQNFNRINLTGKYNGVMGDDKILAVSISTFTSKWDASGQIPTRAIQQGSINRFGSIDNKEGGKTSRSNVNFQLTKVMSDGGTFSQQLFISKYDFELFSNFTFFLHDSINGDQIKQKESRHIYGYNANFTKTHQIKGISVKSEVGLQLRYDQILDNELSHTAQRLRVIEPFSLGDVNQTNLGLYSNETINLSEKIILNVGLRFDQFNFEYADALDTNYNKLVKAKHIFSPKLNLFYNADKHLQLYFKTGTGFHSNDTRVAVKDSLQQSLPRAFGFDLGLFYKPTSNVIINAAFWALDLQQEFVYVGDEAVVEPSGYTRRFGVDFSLRYQVIKWLYIDTDVNATKPRSLNDPEGENYIPLAPTFTSIGGLTAVFKNGLNLSLRYRYVGDRSANSNNTVTAKGYELFDAVISYNKPSYAFSLSMENILNVEWNEAQFETESKLKNESQSVTELHFTPGIPFFAKASFSVLF